MRNKTKNILAFLSAFGLMFIASCSRPVPDQVTSLYQSYTNSVAAGRGYDAAKKVSDATLAEFETLRDLALDGGRGMTSIGIYDEVSVYYLRGQFDVVALEKLNGRDIMNILVKANLVGEPGFESYTLGNIRFNDTEARASLFNSEGQTPLEMSFSNESGGWKIDPVSFRDRREQLLERRIVEFGGSRDEVMGELLKSRGLGNGLTPNLQRPMRG